jgi:hypothetical protein
MQAASTYAGRLGKLALDSLGAGLSDLLAKLGTTLYQLFMILMLVVAGGVWFWVMTALVDVTGLVADLPWLAFNAAAGVVNALLIAPVDGALKGIRGIALDISFTVPDIVGCVPPLYSHSGKCRFSLNAGHIFAGIPTIHGLPTDAKPPGPIGQYIDASAVASGGADLDPCMPYTKPFLMAGCLIGTAWNRDVSAMRGTLDADLAQASSYVGNDTAAVGTAGVNQLAVDLLVPDACPVGFGHEVTRGVCLVVAGPWLAGNAFMYIIMATPVVLFAITCGEKFFGGLKAIRSKTAPTPPVAGAPRSGGAFVVDVWDDAAGPDSDGNWDSDGDWAGAGNRTWGDAIPTLVRAGAGVRGVGRVGAWDRGRDVDRVGVRDVDGAGAWDRVRDADGAEARARVRDADSAGAWDTDSAGTWDGADSDGF